MAEDTSCNFLRPPKPLIVEHDKDMACRWKLWKQQYQFFEIATQMTKKPEEVQIATFMSSIGCSVIQIYNSLPIPASSSKEQIKLEQIKEALNGYFTPKINITFERFKFRNIGQKEGETIDELMSRLRLQAQNCEFDKLLDSLIRDQLILGIRNDELRTKLLSEDISLTKAIQICKATESALKQAAEIHKEHEQTVNVINKTNKKTFDCRRCGKNHGIRQCPAFQHTCTKCKGRNHFEAMCNNQKTEYTKRNFKNYRKNVKCVENETSDSDGDCSVLYVGSVNCEKINDQWSEKILISGEEHTIKLDTGAQCNVLPKSIACRANVELKPSRVKHLLSFSNHRMKVLGEAHINCHISNQKCRVVFKVVAENIKPILGANACQQLGLIKRINKLEDDIYKGLGCFKNKEYDIDLVPNPKFTICPPRRIPYKIRDDVKKELDNMVKTGVIEPIKKPTVSVSPMVVVRKNGKVRICIDPTTVNANLLRRHHPMKTIEEIAAHLHGSTYFTLLDCKRGFWQLRVSDRTKEILTFSTPWGRYCCKRLPFGLASAPELFQETMQSLFANLKNVEVSIDDILIHAKTIDHLRSTTNTVFQILQSNGLKLNKDKCKFEQKTIKFLGHIISENNMAVDPEKTLAINRLKPPINRKELQRVLGKFTYLSKYIKNFSALTTPLRKLLDKNTKWQWTEEQQGAFDKLKSVIVKPPVLKLYNVNEDVKLQVDASSTALGAVLLQNEQPVAYASKALTECQKRYSQLEKEALAIKFGCEKFHDYVWGKTLLIESDHKPLETIFKKPLHSAPSRLQRIRLSLLTYNPNVIYKKGAEMHLADPLSRDCDNPLPNESDEEDTELQVQLILSISDTELNKLIQLTKTDETCVQLAKFISLGWPEDIKCVPKCVNQYWFFRDELAIYDGIIYKSNKVLIPDEMRRETLQYIHSGHFSYEKCVRRAKDFVFWPKMNKDIYEYIQQCGTCQVNQRRNNKESIGDKEIPTYPFEITATDLFQFQGNEYILITDSYSGFIKFEKLRETTSGNAIKFLKNIFASHGIPRILESDNGPQYSSLQFKNFAAAWKFNHKTSSPYHPRGNGLAEKAVQVAKNILKKCACDDSDYQLAMLNFMNTSRGELGSPAQRLYSRNLRSLIPVTNMSLQPSHAPTGYVPHLLQQYRKQQKYYADRGSNEPKQFQPNEKILIRTKNNTQWQPATIDSQIHPRSYVIKDDSGKITRRNSSHIRPTQAIIKTSNMFNFPGELCQEHHDEEGLANNDKELPASDLSNGEYTCPGNHESQSIHPETTTIVSRSGRHIKAPQRLDL